MLRTISCFADAVWSSEQHGIELSEVKETTSRDIKPSTCPQGAQMQANHLVDAPATKTYLFIMGGDKCAWEFLDFPSISGGSPEESEHT